MTASQQVRCENGSHVFAKVHVPLQDFGVGLGTAECDCGEYVASRYEMGVRIDLTERLEHSR